MNNKQSIYTTVVRIESPIDRRGPYTSGYMDSDLLELMMDKHSAYKSKSHPVPHKDGIKESEILSLGGWVAGCKDIQQLKNWFGEFIPKLSESGFKIYRYRIPKENVLHGIHQVVFNPSESIQRTEIQITS